MFIKSTLRVAPIKPIGGRLLVLLVIIWPLAALAQQRVAPISITEQQVVSAALRRASLIDSLDGVVTAEEGRGRAASAHLNPHVSYVREQTFGNQGSSESSISLSQTFDLGNRRGLHANAGKSRTQAAKLESDAHRLVVATDAKRCFYDVMHRRQRVTSLEGWIVRIDETLGIVSRREQRGDAATYDKKRLERERIVASGRLETERATLGRVTAKLSVLLEIDVTNADVKGALLPQTAPADLSTLQALGAARPDIGAMNLHIDAAAFEQRAAAKGWIPDLTLQAGWKGIDFGAQGRSDGFIVGASLSLPLWDRSLGLAAVARGQARAARGRKALLQAELRFELAAALVEAIRLGAAAEQFRRQSTKGSAELVRIASAGYVGGELSLLELLDAYRGAAEDSLVVLDMEHAARQARIDLELFTGEKLP